MNLLIYRASILFLAIAYKAASLFNSKAKQFVSGRKDLFKKISSNFKEDSRQTVWIHCASLGEFEQGRPVIEAIKEKFPDKKILLTFFSPSGYENKKNYDKADAIFYLPWDTHKNAKRFIDMVNPVLASDAT